MNERKKERKRKEKKETRKTRRRKREMIKHLVLKSTLDCVRAIFGYLPLRNTLLIPEMEVNSTSAEVWKLFSLLQMRENFRAVSFVSHFFSEIDWTDSFICFLLVFHITLLFLVVVTHKHYSVQFGFLAFLGILL